MNNSWSLNEVIYLFIFKLNSLKTKSVIKRAMIALVLGALLTIAGVEDHAMNLALRGEPEFAENISFLDYIPGTLVLGLLFFLLSLCLTTKKDVTER